MFLTVLRNVVPLVSSLRLLTGQVELCHVRGIIVYNLKSPTSELCWIHNSLVNPEGFNIKPY